jgi:hypothetical protein
MSIACAYDFLRMISVYYRSMKMRSYEKSKKYYHWNCLGCDSDIYAIVDYVPDIRRICLVRNDRFTHIAIFDN